MDGSASATLEGSDGPVTVAPGAFGNNYSYGVQAVLEPSPAVAQEYYDSVGGGSPGRRLRRAASRFRRRSGHWQQRSSPVRRPRTAKAEAIQDFLLTHFRYQLPKTVPATQTAGYSALDELPVHDENGLLPAIRQLVRRARKNRRIGKPAVVGFLPTAEKHGSWVVTGLQTHAWPQVYFPGTGWVDFEPTPGAGSPPYPDIPTTTVAGATTTTTVAGHTGSSSPAHNLQPPKGGATGSSFSFPTVPLHPVAARRRHWPQRFGRRCRCAPGAPGGGAPVDHRRPARRLVRDRRTRDPVRTVLLAWREAVGVLAAVGIHRRRAETFVEFSQRVRGAPGR